MRRNNSSGSYNKLDMGNSEKTIHGKPWLHTRCKKINKGKHRLQEFYGF